MYRFTGGVFPALPSQILEAHTHVKLKKVFAKAATEEFKMGRNYPGMILSPITMAKEISHISSRRFVSSNDSYNNNHILCKQYQFY